MSTRAFITGVSGTELAVAERAVARAEGPCGRIRFKRSVEISTQVTALVEEMTATRVIVANLAGLSIPVDGVADPAHPSTTSATMIAQVIRSAVGFQGLLMSDDVSMNALAGSFAERIRARFSVGCDTALHSNDNAKLGASIARVTTASA
jgi:beta-glucosidase-like glycosyl hydrolase